MGMSNANVAAPAVVSPEVWRAQRLALLEQEKALTRFKDQVNAERRRLPMVKIEKDYQFDGPTGRVSLLDLFEGRRQLIVYHFMFDPTWDEGCGGCTGFVDALGDLSLLAERDTSFALVSRAPLPKLQAYAARRGWNRTWVSSFGSDFNYDFHVTLDAKVAPVEYNYMDHAALIARRGEGNVEGEDHGTSVFFRIDDEVFHTYSNYARGTEGTTDTYALLDLTPYGRQEDFEDSPEGWPQRPTYG